MTEGKLIILNGTSSSGKTSILNVLQNKLTEPYLHIGLDKFLNFLPEIYFKQPLWNQVMGQSNKSGPLGDRLISGMHHSIKALLQTGNNVLADQVYIEDKWLKEAAKMFSVHQAFLIGIRCPKEIIESREINRKDRTLGSAVLQFECVHKIGIYDFELDSSLHTIEENAQLVLSFLDRKIEPKAFQKINSRL